MRIISFIDGQKVICDILTHSGLRLVRSRPPPEINDQPNREYAAEFGGDMLPKAAERNHPSLTLWLNILDTQENVSYIADSKKEVLINF